MYYRLSTDRGLAIRSFPAAEEDNYPLQLRHLFLFQVSAGLVIVSTYEAEDRTNSLLESCQNNTNYSSVY